MKPTILCVDDEPMILDSLALTLGRQFDVLTATSGAEGLEILQRKPDVAVVLSDMRMPNMNGAEFLQQVSTSHPSTVRMLLTGETDLNSAILAVNEGHIFRFLKKPCAPPELISSFQAAYQQHRLMTAEKVLLEKTLLGSISAMADVMGLISPNLFGRANRIKKTVRDMGAKLHLENRWQVEIAAVVAQLGLITLPHELMDRICLGKDLTFPEQKQIEQLPLVGVKLIEHIPRLEGIREILELSLPCHDHPIPGAPGTALQLAQILKIATMYERFTSTGSTAEEAIQRLGHFGNEFDLSLLEILGQVCHDTEESGDQTALPASKLRVDMVILEDIVLPNGSLFAPRGYRVTESLVERIRNFGDSAFAKPIRVQVLSKSEAA
ncbi:MAG: response regulator [Armatimonadetes bacterium]|nr:response regulator [Armatimonadota bacterium]MBS1703071.1 response regulator [Armatimonadota bacterium]MBS1727638.1 response regulator [Armatimonadota bacterium]